MLNGRTSVKSTIKRFCGLGTVDRNQLLIFFGSLLLLFGVTWRIGFFISDNWTIGNTLVAVADGHLYLTEFPYGNNRSPGTHIVGRRLYGRNYGHVFLSLPFLWIFGALARFGYLHISLPLVWSALLFAFITSAGGALDRRRQAIGVGSVLAVGLFVLNAAFAEPFGPKALPLMALQSSTIVAAALTATVTYTFVRELQDCRAGLFAGAAITLATPVAFWATIPKRHTLTALLPLVSIYWFYRSRTASNPASVVRFRALSYVPVGLTAWIHAPEGLVLFVALASLDFLTISTYDARKFAVVGIVFALTMIPMFVTNTVISGNPFEPPRALTSSDTLTRIVLDGTGQVTESSLPPEQTPSTDSPGGSAEGSVLSSAVEKGFVFLQYMSSAAYSATNAENMYHIFIRGRTGLGISLGGDKPLNLSVLESMPLLGVLLAAPAMLYRQISGATKRHIFAAFVAIRSRPERATDTLVVVYLTLLIVMYLPRLPLRVTFTVRYLHPLYPLGVYLLFRFEIVQKIINSEWRRIAHLYLVFLFGGAPLFVLALSVLTDNPIEAVQLNAGLTLIAGALLGYWGLVSALSKPDYDRAGAVTLAFAGAVTTIFLVLSPLLYYNNSTNFALPIIRLISEWLVLW